VPLTAEEQAELDERDRAILAVRTTIEPYARREASTTFAGAWLDQAEGGLIRVGFTQDVERHVQALRASFPYPERLRGFTASASLDALETVQRRVEGDVPVLDTQVTQVNSVYADVRDNTVKVGVSQPTAAYEQTLRLRYGPEISLERQVPFTSQQQQDPGSDLRARRRIPPVFGGLKLYASGGVRCSSGFSMIDSRKRRRVLTAGHCSGLGEVWNHAGRRVGQTSAGAVGNYFDPLLGQDVGIDAQQMRVRAGFITSRVYVHPGRRTPTAASGARSRSVRTREGGRSAPSLPADAAPVWRSGQHDGHGTSDEGLFRRMGLWEFSGLRTLGGDSGGAVYRGESAFGIHQGLDLNNPSGRAIFTPIPNISRFFGTVVVTPGSLAAAN
jgi:hypothetical protein